VVTDLANGTTHALPDQHERRTFRVASDPGARYGTCLLDGSDGHVSALEREAAMDRMAAIASTDSFLCRTLTFEHFENLA
jgi:hypothetical protein